MKKEIMLSSIDVGGFHRIPPSEIIEELTAKGYTHKKVSRTVDISPADVEIFAAIIIAGSGIISAAVASAIAYISSRKGGKITIKGSRGRTIEVPAGTSKEDISFFIKKAKEIDCESIEIDEK